MNASRREYLRGAAASAAVLGHDSSAYAERSGNGGREGAFFQIALDPWSLRHDLIFQREGVVLGRRLLEQLSSSSAHGPAKEASHV